MVKRINMEMVNMTDFTEGYNITGFKNEFHKKLKVAIEEGRLINSARWYIEERAHLHVMRDHIARWYHSTYGDTFAIGDSEIYKYYSRNSFLLSERAVELPIALSFYKRNKHDTVLEVGNVMHHIMCIPKGYDILDKYEIGKNIINEDVVDYKPNKKYDMIISVSTMEHVGFDEAEKYPNKSLTAIKNIMKLLKPRGKLLITVPLCYNPAIDLMIRKHKIKFTHSYFLKRISQWNYWVSTNAKNALQLKYNSKYRAANAIAVLIKER